MTREELCPGVHITALAGEKFKRYKINLHFILRGTREEATALAVLPHVLERRCANIPDPLQLSRRLFDLYGAELTGESYTAGPNRVIALGISGLKDEFALAGERLSREGLRLLLNLVFHPVIENGAFSAEDVAIEAAKQADFLRNEMNDKRGYLLRQARRKLYGASPLGIESAGYLEDAESITPAAIYAAYVKLLREAAVEVVVCGADAKTAGSMVVKELDAIGRTPMQPAPLVAAEGTQQFGRYTEPMDTVQGKLCILLTNGKIADAEGDAVMRMASAALGGLATSRLFTNVREKQSLCYYCTSIYGAFSGTLQMDSGVDHKNAERAAAAMMTELRTMQTELISEEELANAQKALATSFSAAKDSPDALANWVFSEWLRGTNQTLDEAAGRLARVTREEIRDALAGFTPALEYVLTAKEGE